MSKFFTDRPMLGFLIVSVLAALISAWVLNPQSSPIDAVKALIGGLNLAKTVAAVLIVLAGAAITYIAWRLGADPAAMGLVPAGAGYTVGRRLTVTSPDSTTKIVTRTADDALNDLENMIGLAPVKAEVNKLLASLEIERKRREQGLPVCADQPPHGLYRAAWCRQNRGSACPRRNLQFAWRAAQRSSG